MALMNWKHDMLLVIVRLSILLSMNYKISTIELIKMGDLKMEQIVIN